MVLGAQAAMVLVPLAWGVLLIGQAVTQGTISVVQLGMGGLCCMLVLSQSNWGRLFCTLYNILLVSSMYVQGRDAMEWAFVDIVSSFLFTGATLTLFLPQICTFFRRKYPMISDQASSTGK